MRNCVFTSSKSGVGREIPTEAVFTHETEKEAHGLCVVRSQRGCVFPHNETRQPELLRQVGLRQE